MKGRKHKHKVRAIHRLEGLARRLGGFAGARRLVMSDAIAILRGGRSLHALDDESFLRPLEATRNRT